MIPFRVKDIEGYLNGFRSIFDIVRIVDPNLKKVVHSGDTIIHGDDCYEFWEKGRSCENCISASAIRDMKTFTKVEYKGDCVYMVMVVPIIFQDGLYVLELVKDISEVGIITGYGGLNSQEANDIISNLQQKVIKDDLTGIYNRRYINQVLPMDIENAKRHGEKLTVIMFDIDYFKDINDIYGHLVGDLVLKKLASEISTKIRSNYDWISRYGGDEFLIVLKNSGQEASIRVINEIKNTVENMIIRYEEYNINITISIGSYTIEPGTKNFNETIEEVDKNLKKAKEEGKNKIIAS